jgi:hypothetical protein
LIGLHQPNPKGAAQNDRVLFTRYFRIQQSARLGEIGVQFRFDRPARHNFPFMPTGGGEGGPVEGFDVGLDASRRGWPKNRIHKPNY